MLKAGRGYFGQSSVVALQSAVVLVRSEDAAVLVSYNFNFNIVKLLIKITIVGYGDYQVRYNYTII
ncbi:MAG: hypothetical protein AMR96_02025 [Candidatus Adiutrix intracellularis]|nr:MAG: hypothetical protein AMR96_02025 [Candidatus Adiutrix intracellularis]